MTTMGDVSMNASTSQETTGAPVMMDSTWQAMDTIAWVRTVKYKTHTYFKLDRLLCDVTLCNIV